MKGGKNRREITVVNSLNFLTGNKEVTINNIFKARDACSSLSPTNVSVHQYANVFVSVSAQAVRLFHGVNNGGGVRGFCCPKRLSVC